MERSEASSSAGNVVRQPPPRIVTAQTQPTKEVLATIAVVAITTAVFLGLFNRESALSYSIGYNLYGATRILKGEVPYRDFHTLYPPATVYLNAALFKLFGTYLYTALLGVCVFKILTTLAIYRCARRVMSLSFSLAAAVFSIIWLRPNGPFKAVPMHYGSLFLALSLLMFLKYSDQKRLAYLAMAGVCIALLALFKHNIGGYALIGLTASVIFKGNPFAPRVETPSRLWRAGLALAVGVVLPVLPVLVYMWHEGALRAMIRTLLFGPGEFLANRLASTPPLLFPFCIALAVSAMAVWIYRFKSAGTGSTVLALSAAVALVLLVAFAPEGPVNEIVFYLPVFVLIAGATVCRIASSREDGSGERLYAILAVTAAALMEAFPRFAREQSIAAMPYIGLLLLAMISTFWGPIVERAGTRAAGIAAACALPLMLFVLGGRFFFQTFFERGLHPRSTAPLTITRGRGVYFPHDTASEIDNVVAYVQQKVPESGYVFAQSYAGSSFLFLSDRLNPSGAQFWGGVGVTKTERDQTLASIKDKNVQLVITSDRDLAAERYKPMKDFLDLNFRLAARFGEVDLLEASEANTGPAFKSQSSE